MAHLHQHRAKTLARGQASQGGRRGASSGMASPGWLARRRRDQGGVPHEVPVMQGMTTKGARRAPGGRQPVQCPSFLFGAKEASACVESRGIKQMFLFRCNKTKTARTAGRKSSPSPSQRHNQRLLQEKTTLVKIRCTCCLPSNLAVVGTLPAQYLGRGPGPCSINRTSRPQGKQTDRQRGDRPFEP